MKRLLMASAIQIRISWLPVVSLAAVRSWCGTQSLRRAPVLMAGHWQVSARLRSVATLQHSFAINFLTCSADALHSGVVRPSSWQPDAADPCELRGRTCGGFVSDGPSETPEGPLRMPRYFQERGIVEDHPCMFRDYNSLSAPKVIEQPTQAPVQPERPSAELTPQKASTAAAFSPVPSPSPSPQPQPTQSVAATPGSAKVQTPAESPKQAATEVSAKNAKNSSPPGEQAPLATSPVEIAPALVPGEPTSLPEAASTVEEPPSKAGENGAVVVCQGPQAGCGKVSSPKHVMRQVKLLLSCAATAPPPKPAELRGALRRAKTESWYAETISQLDATPDAAEAQLGGLLSTQRLAAALLLLKVRRILFGLLFFSLALPGLCVTGMVFRLMFLSNSLSIPTKIIVLADTFWKASFYTFLCIGPSARSMLLLVLVAGAMTLASVVVVHIPEVDHADDWVSNFWGLDVQRGPVRINIKGWQAMGFILRPLGLFVLGGFLFVSQIVLQEHVYSGNWLQDELTENEKEHMHCYFMEQVDRETAVKDTEKLMKGEAVPEFLTITSLDNALWGDHIRRAPPSQCHLATEIQPVPAFNVPTEDFAALDMKKDEPKHLRFAPAYLGADGWWWNFTMYFSTEMQTACHYECVAWGDSTAVEKLLEIGMVLGGGFAILLFANEVVIKDFRVLYYAIPGAIRALWNGSGRSENFFLNFIWVTVQATTWMLVKAYCGVYVILTYRSLVVRYSESLADRGLIRCLIYVSLFNVALRTIFCFTKDMWNLGEDNGFHKMESSEDGHRGKKEKHLKSFDLYKWMKLSAREVLEFLFDYIYNLGKEELESDEDPTQLRGNLGNFSISLMDIKVKMIFHATEDQWEIPVGAEGTIRKTPGYGATFEGSKVFVHFHKGIRRVDAERPDRSTERSRRDSEKVDPKGSGSLAHMASSGSSQAAKLAIAGPSEIRPGGDHAWQELLSLLPHWRGAMVKADFEAFCRISAEHLLPRFKADQVRRLSQILIELHPPVSNHQPRRQDIFWMIEIDDDKKLYPLFDKRMAQEVPGDTLGDEFKGYVFRIGGGNDKQGFPMKQGVLSNNRVRLLFKKGMSCYRERRGGCRKRKSVRGCVVGPDLAVLSLVIVKKGAEDIAGLTDDNKPRRLGPKRASNIRKLFGLEKKDDVRQFVVRREVKEGKKTKAPKIQRLITPSLLQRKRYFKAVVRKRMEAGKQMKADYAQRLAEYHHEKREAHAAEMAKKKKKQELEIKSFRLNHREDCSCCCSDNVISESHGRVIGDPDLALVGFEASNLLYALLDVSPPHRAEDQLAVPATHD
eukprot:s363_g9.t4